jgi:hypothetical protein
MNGATVDLIVDKWTSMPGKHYPAVDKQTRFRQWLRQLSDADGFWILETLDSYETRPASVDLARRWRMERDNPCLPTLTVEEHARGLEAVHRALTDYRRAS